MPAEKNPNEALIRELLRSDLHLSAEATFEDKLPGPVDSTEIQPDFIIKDGKALYLIEVKNYATEQSIARLALLEQLLKDTNMKITYVLAAKNIPKTISNLAQRIQVAVIQLPLNIPVNVSDDEGRITTENAWKVVTGILSNELTSIKGVSRRTKISYAWAHRITNRLISRGIAEKFNDQVRINNISKLLNVVALERPMVALNKDIIWTGYSDSHDAATGLTRSLEKSGTHFAFTGFTAASIYTGSAIRHDAVYLYINDEQDRRNLKSDEVRNLRGIKVFVYMPDRDVTADSRLISDVRIVSKEQALLDMAGFGRSGGDLALDLAKRYGSIIGD
jgi:head-tail adaptor